MTLDSFQLWRFKTTDGVLANIKSFNMNETVFNDGTKFVYDYVNETVTIQWPVFHYPKTQVVKFRELTAEVLKAMKFVERDMNSRHSNSYIKFCGRFEK